MTPNKEDYLNAIVKLGGEHTVVSNKKMAEHLKVSAASVTDMTNKLLNDGYVTYQPYKGVRITEKGLSVANKLIRKHRIWEVFLAEKLGFKWDEVHAEADRLEHASSDEMMERMFQFLGEPKTDPHGGVIPNADGSVHHQDLTSLADLAPGETFLIAEVADDKDLLDYLDHKRIHLEAVYTYIAFEPLEDLLILADENGRHVTVGKKAAKTIKVKKRA